MAKTRKVGVPDVPIATSDDDASGLNVADYANALAKFIEATETPMTIGVQGDWGSGKTSLLNLVQAIIREKFPIVWINTWQYSQAEDSKGLPLAVLFGIIHQLRQTVGEQKRKDLFEKGLKAALNVAGKFLESQTGLEVSGALEADQIETIFKRFDAVTQLKEEFAEMVRATAESSKVPGNRVVVFIDDLDRIQPARAIEILEIFKVFLDVPNIVFVLAVDYAVVMKGLKEKFGVSAEELGGRSFFDKIIQVPFQMPHHSGEKVQTYIKSLFDRVRAQWDDADIKRIVEILEQTTGTNPRTIKRLVNILNLLLIVLDEEKHTFDDAVANKAMIVLGLVALQNAYPAFHTKVSQRDPDSVFDDFSENDLEDDEILREAAEKTKGFSLSKVNKVLTLLKEAVAGNGELLLQFINVSGIASVESGGRGASDDVKTDEITQYARDVAEKFFSAGCPFEVGKASRWAGVWPGGWRYLDMWHAKIGKSIGIFNMSVDPDQQATRINFWIHRNDLGNFGLDADSALRLFEDIRDELQPKVKLRVNISRAYCGLDSEVPVATGYSAESSDKSVEALTLLAEKVRPLIEKAVQKLSE